MKTLDRRKFLRNSSLMTVAGLASVQVGLGKTLLRGSVNDEKDLLVYVFLNGGMDGLNFMPPRSGADYTQYSSVLRPSIHIPNNQSLPLNGQNAFGFHPSATGMQTLFNQNKMAIVHATGLLEANRSHFVSTSLMELGVQNASTNLGTGWLTRYFQSSIPDVENPVIPSIVPTYNNTDAILGDATSLVMGNPSEFRLDSGHWAWNNAQQSTLADIHSTAVTPEEVALNQTINSSQIVKTIFENAYVPENNAQYPAGYFGDQLKTVAQLFKPYNDAGDRVNLEVAYVPTGGWDTHVNQGTGSTGDFAELVKEVSDGLNALYQDLSASYAGKFTIIVQSEFGRRAYENSDSGTDHGYGNPMFIIGDNVNPGFHGQFPGLASNQLFEGDDVAVTVDYRDVVSEILMKRMNNRFLGFVFPNYTGYTELGVVQGNALNPVYDFDFDNIFKGGFD